MNEMILFENKKIILFCDRITLKKASKTIYMCDIKSISYTKWSLKNYFLDKAKEIISKIKFKVDFKE